MFQPPVRKFRKDRKRSKQGSFVGAKVAFGEFGMQAVEGQRITARQIEAARRVISRQVKRGGKIFIRIFPDKPISKKPLEVRQGKGKGEVDHYVAVVRPGAMLFEISGVDRDLASRAFSLAASKLPMRVRFADRDLGRVKLQEEHEDD